MVDFVRVQSQPRVRVGSRNTLSRENSGSFLAKYIHAMRTYTRRLGGRVVSHTHTINPSKDDYTKIPSHTLANVRGVRAFEDVEKTASEGVLVSGGASRRGLREMVAMVVVVASWCS